MDGGKDGGHTSVATPAFANAHMGPAASKSSHGKEFIGIRRAAPISFPLQKVFVIFHPLVFSFLSAPLLGAFFSTAAMELATESRARHQRYPDG